MYFRRVEDLQLELETLRAVRTRIEQNCIDLHQSISGKDKAIECLQKELVCNYYYLLKFCLHKILG